MKRRAKRRIRKKGGEEAFLLSAMQAVLALCVSVIFFMSAVVFQNDELKEELFSLVRENESFGEDARAAASYESDLERAKAIGRAFFTFAGKEPVPVLGNITSPFGERVNPILNKREIHKGLDIKAPGGERVGAVFPGKCEKTGQNSIDGNYVMLAHGNFKTKYCHLDSISAEEGISLRAGEEVGRVGSTGLSTGNHLHLEIIKDGSYIDPESAFDEA